MFRTVFRFQPLSVVKIDKRSPWGTKLAKYIVMPLVVTSPLYYYKMKEVPSVAINEPEFELPKQIYSNSLSKFISYLARFF